MANATTIALLNTEETYRSLQPFASIEELNANTTAIRELYADQMTPATYAVLDVLHRYASKYYGVSYRSKSKIAIELGISRKTVTRACATLESMGVIEQYELKRHNGDRRRSSDAIVFIPVVEVDVPTECPDKDAPANAINKSSTTYVTGAGVKIATENVVKEIETPESKTEASEANGNKSLLKESLPDGWYEEAVAYATDYNDLYRITGELFKAKVDTSIRIETHVVAFGEVLRSAFGRLKNGRINPTKWYAYLFAAFKRKAVALERSESVNPILNGIAAMFDAERAFD